MAGFQAPIDGWFSAPADTRNLDRAAQDYRRAIEVCVRPGLYAESAVSFFLRAEDFKSAQELLPLLDATKDETVFLTAVAEHPQAPDEEKRARIAALAQLADRGFSRAVEARFFCVQWATDLKDFALARQCVPASFVQEHPFQGNTLLAWIELEAGNKDPARKAADQALDSSSLAADQQEIAVLGRLLVSLGEHDRALPLLDRAATPGVLDEDCKRLINCAQHLNRHDTLLRICAELRQTNQQDNLVRKLEVQLLSNYAPEQALALARQAIQHDEPYFSAVSNYLAVRLDRLDEVTFDDNNLPNPDYWEPEDAYIVVTPYIETKRYRDALDFAYHLLRRHFAKELAHGQYIWLVLQHGSESRIPNPPPVVDDQSAVRLQHLTTGEYRWVVAEDRQPDLTQGEYSRSSPVVQALLGKRVGDVVDLCGPTLQPQQERVVDIQSKYAHLFQDVLSKFQHRFPGAGTIQSIHLGTEGGFDPAPLIEGLRTRRQHVENVLSVYRKNLCPLHFAASRLGVDERQLMVGFALHDDWFVRCVECSPQQYSEAANVPVSTNKVVLDVSAIITIAQLSAWKQLDRQWEFFVSRATSDTIAEWLHRVEAGAQPTGYSYLGDDGKMIFQEYTQAQVQNERDQLRTIVTEVGSLCVARSSTAIAALDPKRREQYIEVCGFGTLEAVSLAREQDALLWTDDQFVGVLAEVDFGVKRIWTQLAFKLLESAGRIEAATYSEVTAKLAAWNYINTIWVPQDVITAGGLADWDVHQWPLRQCIELIRKSPGPLLYKAGHALEVLRCLRRSTCSEFRQSAIVQSLLDALGNKSVVKLMLRRLDVDPFFQIDLQSANFMKFELAYWLRLR